MKNNFYLLNIFHLLTIKNFKGWGRKRTGRFALWCHETFGGTITLLEDGFIRSLDLGIKGSPSFSIVQDDMGIYYDATTPSRLEHILQTYDFDSDIALMSKASDAIELIKKHHISKYNHAKDIDKNFFLSDEKRVLIIAQTAGDSSLQYGRGYEYTTDEMIKKAVEENPDCKIYLKIHPDVLTGKKNSDINIKNIPKDIHIISEDINPISLLKHFIKVYTKTSGMGFEALLVGCECVCFGMPFYAGWGITDDRVSCDRRTRKLSVEEVFAGAYILYTRYVNPYSKKEIDIIETIQTIAEMRKNN
jgi:capsular polysaccharide export protein